MAGPRLRLANQVLVLATAVGIMLRVYQLTRPGFLFGVTEYDDGVYFGSALRLVHGLLPYRDFVMVQPPGITWLMSPLALLANATTTTTGFAFARVLTAVAGAAGVTLAGLLVRRRGALATALTCGFLAVYPAGVNAAHTVLLEPWVVLFCLLGALAMFDDDQVASRSRRLAWGGAAFGFAAAIKLWAALPVLVLFVLCRRRTRPPYLIGVASGFGAAVLPVAVLAPRALFHDVVLTQLSRVDLTRLSEWDRLTSLTGLNTFSPVSRVVVLLAAVGIGAVVLGCSTAASLRDRRPPPPLEQFAVATAIVVLAAFLWPPDYYLHYGWFFAPFLALSVGLSVARLESSRVCTGSPSARLLTALALCVPIVMTVVQLRQEAHLRGNASPASVRARIAPGACVLTDISALTIAADRFVSAVRGCSAMVDSIGTDYALSRGQNGVTGAGGTPGLQRVWLAAFAHAQYVWLACGSPADPRCRTNRRIPWTPAILGYFRRHFEPVRPPAATPGRLYLRRPLVKR